MLRYIENRYLNLVRNPSPSRIKRSLLALLTPLSWLFRQGVALRNRRYDTKKIPAKKPAGCAIISIGNITAGGTGKTPLCLAIAERLQESISIAILSRGYRSKIKKISHPVLVSANSPWQLSGDEPKLLAKRLSHCQVIVCQDRLLASELAVGQGARLHLLDDGMQHRRLARDLEIIAVNGKFPLSNGRLLPRGLLRECPDSLKRGDYIVATGISTHEHYMLVCKELAPYTKAPIIGAKLILSGFYDVNGRAAPAIRGQKVAVFTGIGNHESFFETICDAGGVISACLLSPDHSLPSHRELFQFALEALEQKAVCLLCTEKDQVKLPDALSLPLPIVSLAVDLKPTFNVCAFEEMIKEALIKSTIASS